MFYVNLLRSGAIGALCMLVITTTQAQNLIINGGFETPLVAGGYYEHRNGSQLAGWSSFSTYRGTVQFTSLYNPVSEGSQAIQLEMPGDSISQSFASVIGQTYLLSFDQFAYVWLCCDYPSYLDVTIGTVSEMFTAGDASYVTHSLRFVADSSVTTLKFEYNILSNSLSPIGTYPELDNVSVVAVSAVPEPETYAMLLAGLGLIVFMARRRKISGRVLADRTFQSKRYHQYGFNQ